MNKFWQKSKAILTKPQETIFSASLIIMLMIVASRVIGLVRLRVLAHFFVDSELALFFASFRLPDLVFEVLTLGALSSAFIPVFSARHKKDPDEAFDTASRALNIGLLVFAVLAILFGLIAPHIYSVIAPGFDPDQTIQIAYLARVLFAAQGFFVVSYAMTGVLESLKRFLIPALAPIFYNLGIILGTYLFVDQLGLLAPALGVVIGAFCHFIIQLPFAYKLGFRFKLAIKPTADVKKIGRLATPRVIELLILQLSKMAELFLASLITLASYTYYTFAYSAQALPVGLVGLSIAKAALPTLSAQSEDLKKFKQTLKTTIYQVMFLIIPMAAFLIVLRVPIIRLLFGTNIFDWEATIQTGFVLSAFAVGVPFQAASLLLTRSFYALHDTKTPVKVSLVATFISIGMGFLLVMGLNLPTWGLAVSYAVGQIFQACVLYILVSKKLNHGRFFSLLPVVKSLIASAVSALVMYYFLKFFDRSVWVKQISFLGSESIRTINFEAFVLDTRYTTNLIILTGMTAFIGIVIYIVLSLLMRSEELYAILKVLRLRKLGSLSKEEESIVPVPSDTSQV